MSYRLSDAAETDIINIYLEGLVRFGQNQAEKYYDSIFAQFELISSNPEIYHLRRDIDPPVRICPFGAHVIVYEIDGSGRSVILRIRHGREDWL